MHLEKETKDALHEERLASFDEAALPHLDAAYNLARWLTRNEADAQDVVQEAYLRAFRYYDRFHGGNCRAWLLTIVRNTCCTWLQANRAGEPTIEFDERMHSQQDPSTSPDAALLAGADREMLRSAIEALPQEFREVIVLRELEGADYKQIAEIVGIPLGTVMSRLARARARLQQSLSAHLEKES